MPSSLAALATLDSAGTAPGRLSQRAAITTSITRGDDLLLYRTLDLPEDPHSGSLEVQRSVAVAAAYYEDKLVALPRELYFAGNGTAAEFARLVGTQS